MQMNRQGVKILMINELRSSGKEYPTIILLKQTHWQLYRKCKYQDIRYLYAILLYYFVTLLKYQGGIYSFKHCFLRENPSYRNVLQVIGDPSIYYKRTNQSSTFENNLFFSIYFFIIIYLFFVFYIYTSRKHHKKTAELIKQQK